MIGPHKSDRELYNLCRDVGYLNENVSLSYWILRSAVLVGGWTSNRTQKM